MLVPPLHHSEPTDPELLDAIVHKLSEVLPLGPSAVVVLLGLVVAAVPALLLLLVARQRRRGAYRGGDG